MQQHTHIGKRSNNEDFLAYKPNVYVVCDGVGGRTKGEVASKEIANYVVQHHKEQHTKQSIQQLITDAQLHLNQILLSQPQLQGMATTFCGMFITEQAIFVAHIGDSRIYVIDEKQKNYWRTSDHSLVGDLLKAQQISEVEAENHPRKNEINRAISANTEGEIVKADITKLTNLKQGSQIFICSDGVLEAWRENDLVNILASHQPLETKKEIIAEQCKQFSKDNNTFVLLEIQSKQAVVKGSNDEIEWITVTQENHLNSQKYQQKEKNKVEETEFEINENAILEEEEEYDNINSTSVMKKVIPFIIIALLIVLLAFFFIQTR